MILFQVQYGLVAKVLFKVDTFGSLEFLTCFTLKPFHVFVGAHMAVSQVAAASSEYSTAIVAEHFAQFKDFRFFYLL